MLSKISQFHFLLLRSGTIFLCVDHTKFLAGEDVLGAGADVRQDVGVERVPRHALHRVLEAVETVFREPASAPS